MCTESIYLQWWWFLNITILTMEVICVKYFDPSSTFAVRFRFTVSLWTSQILDVMAILLMLMCVAEPVLFDMHIVSDTGQFKWHTSKWGSHFLNYVVSESGKVGLEIYWCLHVMSCTEQNVLNENLSIQNFFIHFYTNSHPKTCNLAENNTFYF